MRSLDTSVERYLKIVQSEYREMPGLQLTKRQLQRFLGIDVRTCETVVTILERERFLRRTPKDQYVRQ